MNIKITYPPCPIASHAS